MRRLRLVAFALAAWLGLPGCELLPFFTPDPVRCVERDRRSVACGPCDAGLLEEECQADGRWVAVVGGRCSGNPLDRDGDGFANESCSRVRADDACCGEEEGQDCDEDPERWPGNADLDGDGEDAYWCGGRDCDDDLPERDPADTDKDDDGLSDARCCSDEVCDCDDDDPLRWEGHADLDGDGRDAASCGGNDCDDDDPERWSGHADLDGDGHDAASCGGDDCDDDCEECWPGEGGAARRRCGRARDHDCDGQVDELSGCGEADFVDLCPVSSLATAAARDLFVSGDRAFVATVDGVLEVDVASPTSPLLTGRADTGDSHGVFLSGDDAFVASSAGLLRVDVSRPGRAAITGGPWPTGDSRGVFAAGLRVWVAAYGGLHVVDLRGAPRLLASLEGPETTDSRSVFLVEGLAIVTRGSERGGLYTAFLGSLDRLALVSVAADVPAGAGLFVVGGFAYVGACPDMVLAGAVGEVNRIATYPTGCASDAFVSGDLVYVVGERGLHVFEVELPNPRIPRASRGPFPVVGGRAVFVSGDEVYVAGDGGLHVFSRGEACP